MAIGGCKKPVYVAAESTKFGGYPAIAERPVGHELSRVHAAFVGRPPPPESIIAEKPSRDYTLPSYITMLFTDPGVLTPSAVSDELIKLFD